MSALIAIWTGNGPELAILALEAFESWTGMVVGCTYYSVQCTAPTLINVLYYCIQCRLPVLLDLPGSYIFAQLCVCASVCQHLFFAQLKHWSH